MAIWINREIPLNIKWSDPIKLRIGIAYAIENGSYNVGLGLSTGDVKGAFFGGLKMIKGHIDGLELY